MAEKCDLCAHMPEGKGNVPAHDRLKRRKDLDDNPYTAFAQARAEVKGYECTQCGTKWTHTYDRTDFPTDWCRVVA